jgi:hypothetical protein
MSEFARGARFLKLDAADGRSPGTRYLARLFYLHSLVFSPPPYMFISAEMAPRINGHALPMNIFHLSTAALPAAPPNRPRQFFSAFRRHN